MEENKFEKQVRQKMGELKIQPSASVWENVEKRIVKKHKDGKVIFILFFLILFLLSGGYWLLNTGKNNQQNRQISNVIKSDSKPTLPTGKQANNQDSSLNKPVISSVDNSGKYDTASVMAKKSKDPTILQSTILQDKSGNNGINKKQRKLPDEVAFNPKEKRAPSSLEESVENNEGNEIVLNNPNSLSIKEPVISEIENKNGNADSTNNIQGKINIDSLSDQLKSEKIKDEKINEEITKEELVAKKDPSAKEPLKNQQKNHWVFGITFSGGTSMIWQDLLGINNSASEYLQSSPNPGSGGNPSSFNPSEIKNSIAFIAGGFMEKDMSPEHKISFGINYKYFSTSNKVGSKIDSAVIAYRAANSVINLRNNLNYLELPVSLKLKLSNNKSLPVYGQFGISISQLISSNALQYKDNPGLYYIDNSLFSKTQLGFSAGLSMTLFSKQKNPINIGPYFYYGVNKMANDGIYNNKHLGFIGIRTQILFNKNK